jgi:uncharacterized SAM-binding protein YcdF (DUF218 family)
MFVFLSKVLAVPLYPAGLSLALLAAGLVYTFVLRRHKPAVICFICGFAVLFVFSLPLTSHLLMRGLESRYPPAPIYEQVSAVVLLGGVTTGKGPPRAHVETNHQADRIFHAARVYKETFSNKLVLAGGRIDFLNDDEVPEAYAMFELLNEFFGIDSSDALFETESRNTRENAVYTKTALEAAGLGTDIILVTNAYHMPRSVGIFKKAGFERVIPAPTGYRADKRFQMKPLRLLPDPQSLFYSSVALHEYYGIIAYKIMGWM